MIEDLPDDIVTEDDLDDIEPVGDEAQLYEHFRVVVDRGQEMMRVDKYLFDRLTNASRNRIQKSAEAGFVMANNKPVKSSYKVKHTGCQNQPWYAVLQQNHQTTLPRPGVGNR